MVRDIYMATKDFYCCPWCGTLIESLLPTIKEAEPKGFWDSLVECNMCHSQHFKKVYPDGIITLTIDKRKNK